MFGKRVSQSERLFENNHVTSRQTQRPTDSSASVESVPVFYVHSQQCSPWRGIVDAQVQECSIGVQEYSSVQALLFLDSLRRMTRILFTE